MASACSPATAAPITKTLAGNTVPAAELSIGRYLGSSAAASSTPLYPLMLLMEDSVSMACARVVRGIASVEKAMAPVFASAFISRGCRKGISDATMTVDGLIQSISLRSRVLDGGLIFRRMSADSTNARGSVSITASAAT